MKARHAQAIRFGILAARHDGAGYRMTPDQRQLFEAYRKAGWKLGDGGSQKAYYRELDTLSRKVWWCR